MAKTNHIWKFFRAGGFDQVNLQSGEDICHLPELDQKLWVALSCPTRGLEFDSKTLDLMDTDKDGRIRAPEILAAAQWTCANLKNPDSLLKSSPTLPLEQINTATPEGQQLLRSAKQVLEYLGKPTATEISADDTADTAKIFAQTKFNGDGIITAESTDDPLQKSVIADIIAALGPEADRSGKPGANQAKVDKFFAEITAFADWWQKSENDPAILPLGQATPAAAAAVKAIRAKVDDYFARCRLAAFDQRAVAALNREEKEYLAFSAKDLTISSAEIAALPLARIEANKALPLSGAVNPAWAAALAKLHDDAVKPLLGEREALSEAEWAGIQAKLAAYETWLAGKAGALVEKLGIARAREVLAAKTQDALNALIAADKAKEPEANFIAAVDKLARYHRDLYRLLVNFVNFSDFYSRKTKAIFQAGTLFLDQRSCELCMRVDDPGRHAAMAGLAGTYLAYCDCVRKGGTEKLQIVAAFTGGDADNLMVGRNGIFYDRKGQDWDATISKVVDNPISIQQAFWAPYKKLVRMIEEQVAKRAAAEEEAVTTRLQTVATSTVNIDKTKAAPAGPAAPKPRIDTGTLAAIGLVLTTLLGALGTVFAAILKLDMWQIPFAIVGIVLAISLPSMLIAWLKLHKRNLGPILDANGWAINAKARINVPLGGSLTQVATLPAGAQRNLIDPFAEKKSPWPKLILLALVLYYLFQLLDRGGYLYKWTGSDLFQHSGKVPAVDVSASTTSGSGTNKTTVTVSNTVPVKP